MKERKMKAGRTFAEMDGSNVEAAIMARPGRQIEFQW